MTETHAVLTGPIRGVVILADGTEIDVAPAIVYVDTQDKAHEVAHLVGERYAREGHPDHIHASDPRYVEARDKFVHDTATTEANFAAAKAEYAASKES